MKSSGNSNITTKLLAISTKKANGQAIVIFSLALVALVAFVGLALDGGAALAKRRSMQNAADAASMAGARELVKGSTQPIIYNRITEYSNQRNGSSGFSSSYYPGYQTLGSGSSAVPSGATGVCVTSTVTYSTAFLSLVGMPYVDVAAQSCAIAQSACPGGGYTIWAQGTVTSNCSKVIDWSGASYFITGNVHSNGNILMNGGNNTVVGSTEYGQPGGCCGSGTGNNISPTLVPTDNWPVWYDIEDYEPALDATEYPPNGRPAGVQAQKAINAGQYYEKPDGYHFSAADTNGLYWVDGNATWSVGGITRTVTIVSPSGVIMVSGGTLHLTPYTDDGLLLYSDATPPANQICNGPLINVSGSNSSWAGNIFVPKGQALISGSGNSTLSGGVIAWSVKLTGNSLSLSYSDQYCSTTNRLTSVNLQKP